MAEIAGWQMRALYFNGDYANSHIADIIKEIYVDGFYNHILEGKKDLTIVDIGANIGLTAQYFADYARLVVAVEPCKKHFECLYRNTEGLNVLTYHAAITPERCTMKLYHNANVTGHSLNPELGYDPENVEGIDVNSLFDDFKLEKV